MPHFYFLKLSNTILNNLLSSFIRLLVLGVSSTAPSLLVDKQLMKVLQLMLGLPFQAILLY